MLKLASNDVIRAWNWDMILICCHFRQHMQLYLMVIILFEFVETEPYQQYFDYTCLQCDRTSFALGLICGGPSGAVLAKPPPTTRCAQHAHLRQGGLEEVQVRVRASIAALLSCSGSHCECSSTRNVPVWPKVLQAGIRIGSHMRHERNA